MVHKEILSTMHALGTSIAPKATYRRWTAAGARAAPGAGLARAGAADILWSDGNHGFIDFDIF